MVHSYIQENHLPVTKILVTSAFKKNEGKIFDGQFLDGISNAVDVISMIRYANTGCIILCMMWQLTIGRGTCIIREQ